jgi:orotate phosphoribosyltransferase-like protein
MNSDFMQSARGINDGMVRTVRELSSKGWSSGEISKKLMLDENSVRLIINTATQ